MGESLNSQLSVGTTVVQVSPNKEGSDRPRIGIVVRNSSISSQIISIAFSDSSPAVASSGIVLSPGQAFVDFSDSGYKCWQGNISAVADGASGVLSVMER